MTFVEKLPHTIEWQCAFARVLVEDPAFADALAPHLKPEYFEPESLRWLWATSEAHRKRNGVRPGWIALEEACRKLDERIREPIRQGLEQVRQMPVQEQSWVRQNALEWCRKNVFHKAFSTAGELYNRGKTTEAYDHLMRQMDDFQEITEGDQIQESWLCDDLQERTLERWRKDQRSTMIPTGILELDARLGGGLDLGQFGLMMAMSKIGKTSTLVNFGKVAARNQKNVAHLFFEGSLPQITNRYDASFSEALYAAVKRGTFGDDKYQALFAEYKLLRRRVYVRGFTDHWNCTIEHVWEALERLKRKYGWVPDAIMLDYADLLHGRGRGRSESEFDSNASAYRDIKTLSTKGRGYAIWSAAQAKKPKDADFDTKESILHSSDLGGRYEKLKVCDVLISLNATLEERTVLHRMRIWIEAMRDGQASELITVPCQYDRMLIGSVPPAQPGVLPPNRPQGLPQRL